MKLFVKPVWKQRHWFMFPVLLLCSCDCGRLKTAQDRCFKIGIRNKLSSNQGRLLTASITFILMALKNLPFSFFFNIHNIQVEK